MNREEWDDVAGVLKQIANEAHDAILRNEDTLFNYGRKVTADYMLDHIAGMVTRQTYEIVPKQTTKQ